MTDRDSQQDWAELYHERDETELAIVQRMARGLATLEDARYVAWSFGKLKEFEKEMK